jgi:hypothetical protein
MLQIKAKMKTSVVVRKLSVCKVIVHADRGRKDVCEELLIVTEHSAAVG